MRISCAAALAAHVFSGLLLLVSSLPLAAQDVTLLSRDGSVEISGTLLGFDGEFYRVDTIYGELTVDGTGVLCDGPGCPDLEAYVAELKISGAATATHVLLPALIEGFARRNGLTVQRNAGETPARPILTLADGEGEPVARFLIHSTNTDEGFADLLVNEADVVISLREIRKEEADRAYEAG
ncbi:MAG: cell envelope biogenesis protein OmpA, partial [Pseudooceanicola sp.]